MESWWNYLESRFSIIIRYKDILYWTGFKLDIIKKNELAHKNLVHTYMNLEQGGPWHSRSTSVTLCWATGFSPRIESWRSRLSQVTWWGRNVSWWYDNVPTYVAHIYMYTTSTHTWSCQNQICLIHIPSREYTIMRGKAI